MRKTILLLSLLELGCQSNQSTPSHQSIPAGWIPDTTLHSSYSFVNADGDFIQNTYLLRMYDASHHLGAYAVHDTLYNQKKIVTALFNELKENDSALARSLLKGDISALDTMDRTQHRLITFIPDIDHTE